MPNPILFIPLLASFFVTFLVLPAWIKKAKRIGLLWEDMNKYKCPKNVAGSGGIAVIAGFIIGSFIYIAIRTFYSQSRENLVEIFVIISVILLLAFIGIIDDLLGWHSGGLTKKFRIFLCLFAAIPLIVINVGNGAINLPFFGLVNIGLIYPLILVPMAIMGASGSFDFLAGFNGLEAGQGILILGALSSISYLHQDRWLSLIGLCMVLSLSAFLIFNKHPAKVFPGDIMTYSVGGLIAVTAIFGGIEVIAVFFFIPYIIEVLLKSRGKLMKQSFGKPNKDGSLDMPYDKIYSLNHLAILVLKKIKGKAYEKDAVNLIWTFQIVVILIGVLIFKNSIFGA